MIKGDLVTKIEPSEENVAEENPPHVAVENPPYDWEISCHQNRTFWRECSCRESATWLRKKD